MIAGACDVEFDVEEPVDDPSDAPTFVASLDSSGSLAQAETRTRAANRLINLNRILNTPFEADPTYGRPPAVPFWIVSKQMTGTN